ncbi:alpha-L-rhamnosidase B [Xylariales sp. AK1849]|nr:alpha-L-rhamnosidase B [Xylariales sp. AK1849]
MACFALERAVFVLLLLINSQRGFAISCWRNTPCSDIQSASFPGEWESNIFAPTSRTVTPSVLLNTLSGDYIGTWPGNEANLSANQTSVALDFGLEVGGIVRVHYVVTSVIGSNAIGLAFSEAKDFIGPNSDSTSGNYQHPDGALFANFSEIGDFTYVMPDEKLRGGFRYMTLFLQAEGAAVNIHNVSVEIAFQPTWSNLRAYRGYFHSNDDLLNKIWYSGAYTLQTDAVHPLTGRAWPAPADGGWETTGDLGPGDTILTDGAKRDRTVWPGDLGVAVPASFYSTGDLESTRNALQSLYDYQNSTTGELPFSGAPLLAEGSASYHMWTMIGTYNYVFYSDDLDFLNANWEKYKLGMAFAFNQIDSTGLFYGDNAYNDWGRVDANGTLTSLQAIFYRTLITGTMLAEWVVDTTGLQQKWLEQAEEIKRLTNANNWDASAGAFSDTPQRADVHPQDGNSMAVLFELVNSSSSEADSISTYLTNNWTPIGAECEELPGEISPFISSFEIQAHLLVGQTHRALDLIRTSWGWYLNNPNGTQSTMIEGYLTNGTFGYRWDQGYENDFSYTSHSHGWATGPVTALTEHILGLSITGRAGSTWRLAPQTGDLDHVEGGFTTKLGKFSASWTKQPNGSIELNYDVPKGTKGDVILPGNGNTTRMLVKDASSKTTLHRSVEERGRQSIRIRSDGGKHRILIW